MFASNNAPCRRRGRSRFPLALLALFLLIPPARASGSEVRYTSPYDGDARRAIFGTASSMDHCPSPPAAVKKLEIPGYYENHEEWGRQIKPLYGYLDSLARITDGYLRQKQRSPEAASCGLEWLHGWARDGALVGYTKSRQGIYARKWAAGSIAPSYLKIRDQSGLDDEKKKTVERWIGRLADAVEDSSTGETSRRNNHAYWNGLTNMANGIVLNQTRLFESGIAAYKLALSEMRGDGILPLELDRKEHALHYHNFALSPLIFIAELAARQGIDLYREKSRRFYGDAGPDIHKLADLVIRSLENPQFFKKFSSIPQATRKGKVSEYITDVELTWMEPYYARFKEPRLARFLCRLRPLYNWRTGGDATLAWGVKDISC